MAIGYLVTLGNGSLDANDVISASQSTFTQSGAAIGIGAWNWSGILSEDGQYYEDYFDQGTYYLGTDGNVYFIPDNHFPQSGSGSALIAPAYTAGDGTVSGNTGNDVIDDTYADSDGDVASVFDDIIEAGAGDDVVYGFSGDDTISGEDGNDTLTGGAGNDDLSGGGDADVIYGDTALPTASTSESLNWAALGNDVDLSDGFEQDTGTMHVFARFSNDGSNAVINSDTNTTYVDTAGGDPQSANSSLNVIGDTGPNMTATVSFENKAGSNMSNEVEGVSFRLNDVDFGSNGWQDVVTVNAYDANGVAVAVSLVASDPANDTVVGQTVTGTTDNNDTKDAAGSVLVTISQPVHEIEIIYSNAGTGTQALWITDIHFDTIPAEGGNDTISGGSGDDEIYGGYGDDLIYGDEGIDTINSGDGADTVYGGDGDDVIYNTGSGGDLIFAGLGADEVYGGVDADEIHGGIGRDTLDGELGDDLIYGGDDVDIIVGDIGNDTIHGDAGNDLLFGSQGTDTIYGGDGADQIHGGADADSVTGGAGDDTVYLGGGDDTFGDWQTEAGNDTISGESGNDFINAGGGDDIVYGGAGDDEMYGAVGRDTLYGDEGDDHLFMADDHETNVMVGGEDLDGTDIDTVAFFNDNTAAGITVDLTGDEAGTFDFDGNTANGSFSEIERIETTQYADTVDASADSGGITINTRDGDDSVTGGTGDDTILLGDGADTVSAGSGDDTIELGGTAPDGFADVVVFADGDGHDIIHDFDIPTDNGDGTFSGLDTFDLSGLTSDGGTTPVTTADVVVSANANGEAVLHFPGGESITLAGVAPSAINNPAALSAMGISADGIVSGTDGADTINALYDGDPDGDLIDNNDALLAGEVGDDDIILAGGGNDSIVAGNGDDLVYADSAIRDLIVNGSFEDLTGTIDTTWGDQGTGSIEGWTATDPNAELDLHDNGKGGTYATDGTHVLDMGASPDNISVYQDIAGVVDGETYHLSFDAGDMDFAPDNSVEVYWNGILVDTIAPDGGTMEHYTYNLIGGAGDGSNRLQFTEIGPTGSDGLQLDNVKFVGLTHEGSGDDVVTAGDGDDVVFAGAGNDTISGNAGNDTIYGEDGDDYILNGSGNDTVYGGAGNDTVTASIGADEIYGGDGDDLLNGGGQVSSGHDTIFGEAGNDTLIGGAGNDTAYGGSGDDTIDYSGSGNDLIEGGETGETFGDTLDASNNTVGMDVDFTANGAADNESGTATVGTNTANFFEIENVVLGSGADTVTGSTGAENIDLGAGADTIDAGAGDDVYSLGTDALGDPDGDADVVILADGDGNDIISDFDSPIYNAG